MNDLLHPYLRKFVLVFFDDILIYSSSLDEHGRHLQIVLQVLIQHQLVANRKKCDFAKEEIEYLGHRVSKEGVKADDSKIQVLKNWPRPNNIKELRGFLGLTGYYRRFVANYGIIAAPLTQLLRKDSFIWTDSATQAFVSLKDALSKVPILALPDFSRQFVVETDASGYGLGAVLMQEDRPIAYLSQALSPSQQAKTIYERELIIFFGETFYYSNGSKKPQIYSRSKDYRWRLSKVDGKINGIRF